MAGFKSRIDNVFLSLQCISARPVAKMSKLSHLILKVLLVLFIAIPRTGLHTVTTIVVFGKFSTLSDFSKISKTVPTIFFKLLQHMTDNTKKRKFQSLNNIDLLRTRPNLSIKKAGERGKPKIEGRLARLKP